MRGPCLLHTHHGGHSRQRRAHPGSGFVDCAAKPVTLQYCTSLRVCVCVRCNFVLLPHKRRRVGLPISEPPRAESPCTPSVSLRWCSQRSTPLVAGARARTAWHFHAPAPCTVRPETLEAEHSLIQLKRSRRLPLCGWAALQGHNVGSGRELCSSRRPRSQLHDLCGLCQLSLSAAGAQLRVCRRAVVGRGLPQPRQTAQLRLVRPRALGAAALSSASSPAGPVPVVTLKIALGETLGDEPVASVVVAPTCASVNTGPSLVKHLGCSRRPGGDGQGARVMLA